MDTREAKEIPRNVFGLAGQNEGTGEPCCNYNGSGNVTLSRALGYQLYTWALLYNVLLRPSCHAVI